MPELTLLSGQNCCLCDEAETLIAELSGDTSSQLQKVDVRSTPELYHLYGARIPILRREDNQSELPWPFDSQQLTEFLR